MLWEGLAGGTAALEALHRRLRHGRLGGDRVLGGGRLQVLELQFHLLDQPGAAFGPLAILLTLQLGDLELEVRDHRLGGRHHRPRLRQLGLGGRQLGAKSGDLGGVVGHG